jgi:hypothetical protein
MKFRNGQTTPAVQSQWRLKLSEDIPPLAFGLPDNAFAADFLAAIDRDLNPQAAIEKYIRAQMEGRYGDVFAKALSERDAANQTLRQFHSDRQEVLEERRKEPLHAPTTEPKAKMPSGWLAVKTFIYVALLILLGLSEWFNAAGFAARQEMGSLPMALMFTFVFAVASLAIKEWHTWYSGLASRAIQAAIPIVGLVLLAAFVGLYAFSFPPAGSIDDAVRNALQGGSDSAHKRTWLLLSLQIGTSIMLAIALQSAIGKSIIFRTQVKKNPARKLADQQLDNLDNRIKAARACWQAADGTLKEWQGCVEAHVARCKGLLEEMRNYRQASGKRLQALDQEVQFHARNLPWLDRRHQQQLT